jgi:hypothetical protein
VLLHRLQQISESLPSDAVHTVELPPAPTFLPLLLRQNPSTPRALLELALEWREKASVRAFREWFRHIEVELHRHYYPPELETELRQLRFDIARELGQIEAKSITMSAQVGAALKMVPIHRDTWPCAYRWSRSPASGARLPDRDLGNECIEVVDQDGVHGVTGVLGPLLDEHRPMLGKCPHGLCVGRNERRRGAEQLFVPGSRRLVVVNWDSRVQVNGHAAMIVVQARWRSLATTRSTGVPPRNLFAAEQSRPKTARTPVHHRENPGSRGLRSRYSPECVEGVFCEPRPCGVLGCSARRSCVGC